MNGNAAVERVLRRDRVIVATALLGVVVLAGASLFFTAGPDLSMNMGMAVTSMPWTLATFGWMLVMWIAMMIAMMLPSAAPVILLFAAIDRRKATRGSPHRARGLFSLGYLAVWAAFGIAAAGAQWGLQRLTLLSPTLASGSTVLAGALFLLAGLYQLTPLKKACLRQCRSPFDFLTRYWDKEAFGMGLRHGLFCLGCCWAMMALLFVGGVMNVLWIAALAIFVLVEKISSAGRVLGRATGIGLILWGGATLLTLIA